VSDPSALFVSLMVSIVGLAIFVYGKRQQRLPQLLAGVALMAYPFFVSNVWLQIAIAAGIGGLLWLAVRAGL
jgi:hypothetical protein